jgi:hypothetical protein
MSKLYDRLTAEERFKLVVAARARDDQTDLTRLIQTCPQKDYRQYDAAFVDRMDAVEEMGMVALIGVLLCDRDLMKALAAVRLEAVVRRSLELMIMDRFREDIAAGRMEPPLEGDVMAREMTDKAIKEAIAEGERPDAKALLNRARGEAAGIMASVADWCQEIGLPLDDFLAVNPVLTSEWNYLKYVLADAEPDEEIKAHHLDSMRTCWNRLIRNVTAG